MDSYLSNRYDKAHKAPKAATNLNTNNCLSTINTRKVCLSYLYV